MISRWLSSLFLTFLFTHSLFAASPSVYHHLNDNPEFKIFINQMVKKHKFNRQNLVTLFKKVKITPKVIKRSNAPTEDKKWYQYERLLVTNKRIYNGVRYWLAHKNALAQAERQFGVPAEIIVAILGIETNYGANKGRYKVINSLSTLAFGYPRRGSFFRSELGQFLLLCREQGWDPLKIKGSYSGAIGYTQFIPSSYRHYAVDFDKDGHVDLIHDNDDAIGSIANYFKEHGWQKNAPVVTQAAIKSNRYKKLRKIKSIKPYYTLSLLKKYGLNTKQKTKGNPKASFFQLREQKYTSSWLGFHNFYAITRYNRSINYAMAIYRLSQAIKAEYATLEKAS